MIYPLGRFCGGFGRPFIAAISFSRLVTSVASAATIEQSSRSTGVDLLSDFNQPALLYISLDFMVSIAFWARREAFLS